MTETKEYGVVISGGSGTEIHGNEISHSGITGLIVFYHSRYTVSSNIIDSNSAWGFYERGGGSSILKDNIIQGNNWGLALHTRGVSLENNTLSNHIADAMFSPGRNVEMVGNAFARGIYAILGEPTFSNVEGNTVKGKPLVYITGEQDVVVRGDPGQILVTSSSNVTIENHTWTDVAVPILTFNTHQVHIRNNVIDGAYTGVRVEHGSDIALTDNHIQRGDRDMTDNHFGRADWGMHLAGVWRATAEENSFQDVHTGIRSVFSVAVEIRENDFLNGTHGSEVRAAGQGTIIENNRFEGTESGIILQKADETVVRENTLKGGTTWGIALSRADNNVVANNTIQGYDRGIHLWGWWLSQPSDNIIEANSINGNKFGIFAEGEVSDTTIRYNNIYESTSGVGLWADINNEADIDAQRNWWGCPGGPPDDGCDSVRGSATFDPWLEAPNDHAGAS